MRLNLLIGLGPLVALVAAVAAVSSDKDPKRADAPELSSTEQGSGEVGGKVAAFRTRDAVMHSVG